MTAYHLIRDIAAQHTVGSDGWNQLVRIGRYVRKQERADTGYVGIALEFAKPRKRSRSAMDIAADSCGLKKVKGALGGTYYE